MNVVKIQGGLGNQLFQVAFAYALLESGEEEVCLDLSYFRSSEDRCYEVEGLFESLREVSSGELKRIDPWSVRQWPAILRRRASHLPLLRTAYYREPHYHHCGDVFRVSDSYLEGYWQSPVYFEGYEADISAKIVTWLQGKAVTPTQHEDILLANATVALHVRRGDYVTSRRASAHHGNCSLEYYRRAVEMIAESEKDDITVNVFSDDIGWARQHLQLDAKTHFPVSSSHFQDLLMMSLCKHQVVANSSFSWWGAWLNRSPGRIVVAPLKWFVDESIDTSDLIPSNWFRL